MAISHLVICAPAKYPSHAHPAVHVGHQNFDLGVITMLTIEINESDRNAFLKVLSKAGVIDGSPSIPAGAARVLRAIVEAKPEEPEATDE